MKFTTQEMDAVPTSEIPGRTVTLEEQREWLQYSLFVLQPRGKEHEQQARSLMFNPFNFLKWRRAQKKWEATTERMNAILKMKVTFANERKAV